MRTLDLNEAAEFLHLHPHTVEARARAGEIPCAKPGKRWVQGETDSFGAEYLDLCQECLDELKKHEAESRTGRCDWCGKQATDLRPRRDFEEGLAGRVYDVCGECVRKENESLRAEMDERDYYDCDYDD